MARLKYWVWLSCVRNVRAIAKCQLLEELGGPEGVYHAGRDELIYAGAMPSEAERLMDKSLSEAERVLEACERSHTRILTLQDAEYPDRLRGIPDPPAALFIRGRLPAVDESAVIGIVGTRKATPYGLRMAQRLGTDIAAGGGVVVSGLAEGCDSVAMEAALRANGTVIGVLGTSIEKVYPAKNRWLFRETERRGALVSEHGPGVRTFASDFKARNRIISGLSLGVAVVEAPTKSGTRVTVDRAIEQGRDIFAVPSSADSPMVGGYKTLVGLGAHTVFSGADILECYAGAFGPVPPVSGPVSPISAPTPIKKEIDKPQDIVYIDVTEKLEGLSEPQRRIMEALDRPDMHADELIEATGLSAPEALAALTMLQVAGYVVQGAGRRYTRNL